MELEPTERWHPEVPGARRFRADLHMCTPDNPYVELPPGIQGERVESAVLGAYAERLLDSAVKRGIAVLGITPDAVCIDLRASAAWMIVETLREIEPFSLFIL